MKRVIDILAFGLLACSLSSCEVEVAPDFDPTYTAKTIYEDVDAALNGTVWVTSRALALSLYIESTDTERYRIEDNYFSYLKVRNDGVGTWRVYNERYAERYYLADNKSLLTEGARWFVNESSAIYGDRTFDSSEIIIKRVAPTNYTIVFNNAELDDVCFNDYHYHSSYYDRYYDCSGDYRISGELSISTDFFGANGQNGSTASFTLGGAIKLTDADNANYSLDINIDTPYVIGVGLPQQWIRSRSGRLAITVNELVSKAHETITATVADSNEKVHLKYTTADGTFESFYDLRTHSYRLN